MSTESARPALIVWGVIFLLLLVPAEWALHWLGDYEFAPRHAWALLAMLGVLASLQALLPSRIAAPMIAVAVVGALFVRLLYLGVVHFSGAGFSDDFFIHLEWESVVVAWKEYRGLLLLTAALLVAAAVLCMVALGRLRRPRTGLALLLLVTSLGVLAWGRAAMPEWQLLRNAQHWYAPTAIDIDAALLERWRGTGLVEIDLLPKRRVLARAPEAPRNLILVYLESVGTRVLDHPSHPQLMPFLKSLQDGHALLPAIHHSSYITIEGLVNSMCGTLFGFERGSEALLGYEGMAEDLPCLGDVLRAAGYRQVYMGGADLGFAGKGEFLRNHGYDRVLGQVHWAEQGVHQRPDTWGVSDADLFELAFAEIASLREASQPFNLTLLTIGTHLPGYSYAECRPYDGGTARFLQALHCTDQLLERFVTRLREEGHLEDSLLAITADHHIFASPGMRRLFGDEVVEDRRLPLVILGAGSARAAAVSIGAGYDLAPTLLDLLEVQHNARFALGRSLLSPAAERRHFVTRYHDIHDHRVWRPEVRPCAEAAILDPPFDQCAKKELMALLGHIHAAYSAPPLQLSCDDGTPGLRVRIPDDAEAPLEFAVGAVDVSRSFLRQVRPVAPTGRGLYMLALDRHGQVVERSFAAQEDAEALAQRPSADGHGAWLLAWRGDDGVADPPTWLPELTARGVWLLDPASGELLQAGVSAEGGMLLEVAPVTCSTLLAGRSGPGVRAGL